MTLEPRKAQNQQPKDAEGREKPKRARRVAPEYTLVWSDDAWRVVRGRSRRAIKEISDAAYARIWRAEEVLCGKLGYVTIVPMPPLSAFDKWWAPFPVGDLWFVLKYEDKTIREYHLLPADGPAPDDGGDPPVMTRRQKTPPPAEIVPRLRARKNRGTKGARPAAAKRPSKQTENARVLLVLYNLIKHYAHCVWNDCRHTWAPLQRRITPRLARIVEAMRRLCGIVWSALQECRATLVQMLRESASLTARVKASFTGTRQLAVETRGPEARLEPRYHGRNIGLPIVLYSWIWDDEPPPVDWTANLFGVLPVDWTANLFGVPPEEERAFR